jgi:hypothetical protein
MLSEKARKNKVAYNIKRNYKLTSVFSARLSKEECKDLCDFLKTQGMNKADFVRWAFDKLKEN